MERLKEHLERDVTLLTFQASKYKDKLISQLIEEIIYTGKKDELWNFLVHGKISKSGSSRFEFGDTVMIETTSYITFGDTKYYTVRGDSKAVENLKAKNQIVTVDENDYFIATIVGFHIIDSLCDVKVIMQHPEDNNLDLICVWSVNTYALKEYII